jgi:hypothetical protein
MLRLAAWDRGCDSGRGKAAVDSEAVQRQPPRAEVPLLQLSDEARDQPFEGLACGFRMCCRFLQPECRSRRRVVGRGGERFGLLAKRSVERIDDVLGSPKAPRER